MRQILNIGQFKTKNVKTTNQPSKLSGFLHTYEEGKIHLKNMTLTGLHFNIQSAYQC